MLPIYPVRIIIDKNFEFTNGFTGRVFRRGEILLVLRLLKKKAWSTSSQAVKIKTKTTNQTKSLLALTASKQSMPAPYHWDDAEGWGSALSWLQCLWQLSHPLPKELQTRAGPAQLDDAWPPHSCLTGLVYGRKLHCGSSHQESRATCSNMM